MNELQKRQPEVTTKLKDLKAEQPVLFRTQGRYFVKGVSLYEVLSILSISPYLSQTAIASLMQ